MNNQSPLEQLAAFAICFALGVVTTLSMAGYAKLVRPKSGVSMPEA